jgi:CHAT domain
MSSVDNHISLLKLKVKAKENKIYWFFAPVNSGHALVPEFETEDLKLSDITRRTISFLVRQLQHLASMTLPVVMQDNMAVGPLTTDTGRSGELTKLLGEYLYRTLFTGEIQKKLNAGLNANLLRVELEFDDDDELASWPWEYLYRPKDKMIDSNNFLVEIAQLVLNRMLSLKDTPLLISLGTPRPVKVLMMISRPADENSVECDLVLQTTKNLHDRGVIERKILIDAPAPEDDPSPPDPDTLQATRENFEEVVKDFKPNIIHFIGHGKNNGKQGMVAFVGKNGRAQWVPETYFANWATPNEESRQELKLVFLQACESALSDPYNSISGMALRLAHKNVPAVIAMQYKIKSRVADTFASGFYNALAEGKPVDMAVKAGRDAITEEYINNQNIKNQDIDDQQTYAFGLPVLYLRSYDSIILNEKLPDTKSAGSRPTHTDNRYICPACEKVQQKKNSCVKCGLIFKCIYCNDEFEDPKDTELFFCGNCKKPVRCQECEKQLLDDDKGFNLCETCRRKKGERPVGPAPRADMIITTESVSR